MKRGRPKGRPSARSEVKSHGPLGDLIRKNRLEKGLGLSDVASACQCSVQFVSNIEHGRAPLPWEKVPVMASVLKIPVEDLQAANLAIRSDFKSFVTTTRSKSRVAGTANAVAMAAKDTQLRDIIARYQTASVESRKRFIRAAADLLIN